MQFTTRVYEFLRVLGLQNTPAINIAAELFDRRDRQLEDFLTAPGWAYIGGASPAPGFVGTWTNYGSPFQTARFTKDRDGFVMLEGHVTNGAAGSDIFYLPLGYRPTKQILVPAHTNTGYGHLSIGINGQVTHMSGGTLTVSLLARFSTL